MLLLASRSSISLFLTLSLKHPILATIVDLNHVISFLNKLWILLYSSF